MNGTETVKLPGTDGRMGWRWRQRRCLTAERLDVVGVVCDFEIKGKLERLRHEPRINLPEYGQRGLSHPDNKM